MNAGHELPRSRPAGTERGGSERQRRRSHPVLIAIAVVGCLQLFFLLAVELDRNLVHRREVARLEGEVQALSAELERLQAVAAHGEDRAYREVLARQQGFVYPDEALLVTRPE